jgi:hypothetical protein
LITKSDALYYHSAVVIYGEKANVREGAEAMIYIPDGVQADFFTAIMSSRASAETLAFLQGLHDVSIALSKQLNLGTHCLESSADEVLGWARDEVKIGGGLIAPLLRRKAHSILDALGSGGRRDPPLISCLKGCNVYRSQQ